MGIRKRAVKVVAFGFLGTLVDELVGRQSALIEVVGPHRGRVDLEEMAHSWYVATRRLHDGPYAAWPLHVLGGLEQACEAFQVPYRGYDAEHVRDWVRRWPLRDDSSAVARLGARYRIAILSQLDRDSLAACLPNLPRQPDYTVTSDYARAYKPDPGYFRLLRSQLRLGEPHHLLIISADRETDLEAAAAVGYQTLFVDRSGSGPDEPHDLHEAVALLS